MVRLPPAFFARDALIVAPALLGRRVAVGVCSGTIVEVEAYTADDPASHSVMGRTPRNTPMFGPPGRWYVYLSYGIHHCANVVTGVHGDGQAVLIRAVVPRRGMTMMAARRGTGDVRHLADGPGKFAQAFGLDLRSNGRRVVIHDDGDAVEVPAPGPRVGITKAVDWPRRWVLANATSSRAGGSRRDG